MKADLTREVGHSWAASYPANSAWTQLGTDEKITPKQIHRVVAQGNPTKVWD